MAAQASLSYTQLLQDVCKHKLAPVYILHGEEGYFLDRLIEQFENVIPESDRDFNLYTLYAPEVTPELVMSTCRRVPMMTDRQVVIVKEAQEARADQINKLHSYVATPNPQTVLVICFRGAQAKGKDLMAKAKSSGGVIFESKKLTDRNIEPVISSIVKEKGLNIEPKGLSMLRDFIGADAAKLYNEIDKLALILGPGSMITPESIERNVGVSKDYNNFELVDAIAVKDAAKAFAIVRYFRANPKNNPAILTASALFAYFSNILIAHFTRDKSPQSLMAALGIKWQSMLSKYEAGMRNYNAFKTIEIISVLRQFDVMSKGIGSRQNEYDLLHNLIFKILNAPGDIRF